MSGLPVPADSRVRRREPEPDDESGDTEPDDYPYRITGKGVRRFVLSFCVLYTVLAVSLFSVFALQDQAPALITGALEQEVNPGEEASFPVTVKNPSILEKEYSLVLEKDVPAGWVASFCSEEQCFYEECTERVKSLQELPYTVNIITDMVDHSGSLRLLLYYDGKIQGEASFTVETTKRAEFTTQMIESTPDQHGVSFSLQVANTGNVSDTYTVFLPSGVTATVSEPTFTCEPGQKKDVTVYVEENQKINTSVVVTAQSGLSETLYLICEQSVHYDFELYAAREYYIDEPETAVTFDIINMGDGSDTYHVHATCLSEGWEVECSSHTVTVDSKKSERVNVRIKRGEGKSTSIIVTATSESDLSKNVKINVYVQETQGKTVLAEYFTGTWCYVCSYGERALRQLAEELENLVVLVYHLKDELETPGTQTRTAGVYGFTDNVSTLVVNGTKHAYYSTGGEGAIYFKYKNIIEEMLSEGLKAEVYVSGHVVQDTAYVTAEIHPYISGTYDVYFVLFKNDFEYRGETKQYIARDVAAPQRVSLSGEEKMVSCEFTLPKGESFQGYGVVVIIQNPHTLEVIQANSYMF